MEIKVKKRDGSYEEFDKNKLEKVVIAAGLTQTQAQKLLLEVEDKIINLKKTTISSIEIADIVSDCLRDIDLYAYNLFIWYQKVKDRENKK